MNAARTHYTRSKHNRPRLNMRTWMNFSNSASEIASLNASNTCGPAVYRRSPTAAAQCGGHVAVHVSTFPPHRNYGRGARLAHRRSHKRACRTYGSGNDRETGPAG
jgi:hypothetical protein